MEQFDNSKIEMKIDRLNAIWESVIHEPSPEIEKEAFTLLREIMSEKPLNDGRRMLADCYFFGIGCEENIPLAKELYLELSKDPEHFMVFKMLGDIAYNEKDVIAFEYYQNYMQHAPDDIDGYSCLANCYYIGLGTPQNIEKAMSMYKEISTTDYANTTDFQTRYASALDEQECEESLNWFLKAANSNDSWATYKVGSIFKEAKYLPFDKYPPELRIKNALNFFERAHNLASAENDIKLANLTQDAITIFKAKLNINAFAFYYKAEDGKEVACRCQMNE